jgi:3-deoxy-D-manno-octulosonic-acid transferase
MPYLLNLLYLSLLLLLSPLLVWRLLTQAKYRRNLWTKFLGKVPRRDNSRPCVWFHGVSVGEVHLLRQVVARFRRARQDCEVVISTSTATGLDEARKHFADLKVFCWPLDFTWAVKRALRKIRPALVVLAESEVWPNFVLAARQQGVKVAVINGRMSPRSLARYRLAAPLVRWLLRKIDLWAMQNDDYAAGVRDLGIDAVAVTGNVKYDGVKADRDHAGAQAFRRLFGIQSDDLVWVAGSTQTPEEDYVLEIFQKLKASIANLRLILVPRQKDRFDAVAETIRRRGLTLARRSELKERVTDQGAVILVDTIGELSDVWALADLAFVGGSLDGQRGGQNMIESAAYGAAVVFGPHTWNFKDTVTRLLGLGAALQVENAAALGECVARLAGDPSARQRMGESARQFVQTQQGATERTVHLLLNLLSSEHDRKQAA